MDDNKAEYEKSSRQYSMAELKDAKRLMEIKREFASDKVVYLDTWRKLLEFEKKANEAHGDAIA